MKIEIELKELELLRQETSECRKELEKTQQELKQLKEKTDAASLRKKAIEFAEKLTQKYLEVILKGLGFKNTFSESYFNTGVLKFDRSFLDKNFGETWYLNGKDLKVTVGAEISDVFREAYIRIGVKPEPPKTEEEVQKDLLEL